MSKDKTRGLGRGLDALLPSKRPMAGRKGSGAEHGVFTCSVEKLVPQKGQPRQHFDETRIQELADSIKAHGMLEPIVVRRSAGRSDRFEIIAGERRWRASQKAGITEVLVVVKDVSPAQAFELALIENVQREDLNPIEFAEALERLMREHNHTHEALAGMLKKDRSTITNALRLLKLPARVRTMVIDGRLSEGHGRTLLGAPSEAAMNEIADKVIRGRLNVRQTEALVRLARGNEGKPKKKPAAKTPAVKDVELRLERRLGSKVELRDKKGKGEIAIRYASLDELDRLLDLLRA